MVRTASTPTSRCAAHGSPTWQSPNEGEHRALQVPPEDGQPLLQLCRAHFTLAFGAIDHQGGSILLYGDGHHMLLAVTDLDLHQGQGDILRSQDDQLQGRSTPEHTAVRAVQPRDLPPLCALSWARGPLASPMPQDLFGGGGLLQARGHHGKPPTPSSKCGQQVHTPQRAAGPCSLGRSCWAAHARLRHYGPETHADNRAEAV